MKYIKLAFLGAFIAAAGWLLLLGPRSVKEWPKEELARQTDCARIQQGMSVADVEGIMGGPATVRRSITKPYFGEVQIWPAAMKSVDVTFRDGRVAGKSIRDRTLITYWEKWTGTEGAQMEIIVDDFNNSVGIEKGIYVQYLSMSRVNEKTLVAAAAGVPPDVAGVWDNQVAQYAAMDAIVPLGEYARSHGITRELYKPVYWDACMYEGKLWGLVSTPWAVALHYNKRTFHENADKLRAAGLDPDRAPRTLDELDRYAAVLDIQREFNAPIDRAGYLPMEPGWFVQHIAYWFGGSIFDEKTQRFTLTDPRVIQAYEWMRSYSQRLGPKAARDFKSGTQNVFATAQNAFLVGSVVMEQQGPWMALYIETLAPSMNRWNVPPDQLERERNFPKIEMGMSRADVEAILGAPSRQEPTTRPAAGEHLTWPAGIRTIEITLVDGKVKKKSWPWLPPEERKRYFEWGTDVFPSAVPGLENVTLASFDVLVIPREAKHKDEAFEFIAYVNRQDVQEKIDLLHCKNSVLRKVSPEFIRNHRNPYIDVYERMAAGPNARPFPSIPIWQEVDREMQQVAQASVSMSKTPREALTQAQARLQARLEEFNRRQAERRRMAAPE